ncbi:NUDIX domain-containing protein [Metabacillus idriensis]|uniref:NUDIX hydrolase n=1 Tax=Metabacillus idriensis TaxID=324768 RepID=A0A6I2M4D3_9BACI|nr:NUDIX domain-containing protein [Metabacillus idriensis]MCM3595144.1 NUDIX domain-containing protein [Metabacillus idriensis]MRX52829.1 NUDIX hydrolase [Metabacillus idriensis]OHR65457.1 NUDIX hydrolase [Bacillus sp. HMSC76G11]
MEYELLRIFDENHNPIGKASRSDVHKTGYWHETFHCWFAGIENGRVYLYFQLRSKEKKDYPNLFDITAAGHILANETIEDGTREVEEEIGIQVSFSELVLLDVIKYCVSQTDLIDNEIAHVFFYPYNQSFEAFTLQKEEVSGMVRADLHSFRELISGRRSSLLVEGFEVDHDETIRIIQTEVDKTRFVPHEDAYYVRVLELIEEKMNRK